MNMKFTICDIAHTPGHKRVYFYDQNDECEDFDTSIIPQAIVKSCKLVFDEPIDHCAETSVPMSEDEFRHRLTAAGFIPLNHRMNADGCDTA